MLSMTCLIMFMNKTKFKTYPKTHLLVHFNLFFQRFNYQVFTNLTGNQKRNRKTKLNMSLITNNT